jgi:ubiquitin C-terminal hydrolase
MMHSAAIDASKGRRSSVVEQCRGIYENAGRCGLVNFGNTCYMNAPLQVLIHLLPLVKFVHLIQVRVLIFLFVVG